MSEVLCTFTPCMSALVLIPRDEPTCHAWMYPGKRCGWSRDISAETLCVLYGDILWDLIATQGGRGERPGAFLSILVVHGWKEYLAISLILGRKIGPSNSVQWKNRPCLLHRHCSCNIHFDVFFHSTYKSDKASGKWIKLHA